MICFRKNSGVYMKNKKGFTLIELLAVLVVLAILALISIPITIRIINSARENSYKRSIAAYGRAVENAVGQYLIDNSNIEYKDISLNLIKDYITYSGNNVICKRLTIKTNSDIKLEGCTVKDSSQYKYENRKVEAADFHYNVGDQIKVSGMDFYVIRDIEGTDYVTALKAEPLKADEINEYGGVGTDHNHVNRYTQEYTGEAYRGERYGGMTYYSSETCGYVNGTKITSGCSDNYNDSDVKYVIDAWAEDKFRDDQLKAVNIWLGGYGGDYKARLLKMDDYWNSNENRFNDWNDISSYEWAYTSEEIYWTLSSYGTDIKYVVEYGYTNSNDVYYMPNGNVRPVINVYKNKIDS